MARLHPQGKLVAKDPQINSFLEEFQKETDRAAAVLGPAMLDELVKELLNASFTSSSLAKKLTGRMMPIGTFSSRITLAQAIGLISSDEAKDLHCLRDIRNDFAHELHGLSFSTQSVKDRCNNLTVVSKSKARKSNAAFAANYPSDARASFNLAVTLSIAHLKDRIAKAVRFSAASYVAK